MPELLSEMLSYGFLRRALVVGLLVALCAALLGVSLVLKRYSMIGDGLSHVSFGALAIAVALMIGTLLVIKAIVAKKHQGIFQEMAEANKALATQK